MESVVDSNLEIAMVSRRCVGKGLPTHFLSFFNFWGKNALAEQ
jgi:hypothetical protein